VFGLGAIVLGIRQVRLGGHRSDRFLGAGALEASGLGYLLTRRGR
jgi:hypothetical protein